MIIDEEAKKILRGIGTYNLIGLEFNNVYEIEKNMNNQRKCQNNKDIRKLNNVLKKIEKEINDKEFVLKVLTKFNFLLENGNVKLIEPNKFKGKIVYEKINYEGYLTKNANMTKFLTISRKDDEIKELSGTCELEPNGNFIIKYIDKETKIYKNDTNYYYDVKTISTIEYYNNDGYQLYVDCKKKQENYYYDYITNKKVLSDSNVFENNIERIIRWRTSYDTIIERKITQYLNIPNDNTYELDNSDIYSIGNNIEPTAKKMPVGGSFNRLPDEICEQLYEGVYSIEDVKNAYLRARRTLHN